jgi:hypothetical protein
MDTTYFGRNLGVMVFKDTGGHYLHWKFVKYETIAEYVSGIRYIESQDIKKSKWERKNLKNSLNFIH